MQIRSHGSLLTEKKLCADEWIQCNVTLNTFKAIPNQNQMLH